jgi:hypothetical protein
MFVRWKRWEQRKRGDKRLIDITRHGFVWGYGSRPTGVVTRTALLIESERTPDGPRHCYRATLGKFAEGTEHDPEVQRQFWEATERGLDRAEVEGAQRQKILETLAKVVPPAPPVASPGRRRAGSRKDTA